MAKLNLYIFNDNGQTRTRIGNKKGFLFPNEIVFHNDSNAELKVDFDIAMKDKNGPTKGITVPAGCEETVKFNAGAHKGAKVKYTAKIEKTTSEDPIIIID